MAACSAYMTRLNLISFTDLTHRQFCFDVTHAKEKLPINGAEIYTFFQQIINNHIKFVRGIILLAKRDLISLCTHITLATFLVNRNHCWKLSEVKWKKISKLARFLSYGELEKTRKSPLQMLFKHGFNWIWWYIEALVFQTQIPKTFYVLSRYSWSFFFFFVRFMPVETISYTYLSKNAWYLFNKKNCFFFGDSSFKTSWKCCM